MYKSLIFDEKRNVVGEITHHDLESAIKTNEQLSLHEYGHIILKDDEVMPFMLANNLKGALYWRYLGGIS